MKKELGKWLMDISKYITTAVVLSSIFGGITETWKILTLGFITISASIITGLLLIRSSEKEEKQNKYRINKVIEQHVLEVNIRIGNIAI